MSEIKVITFGCRLNTFESEVMRNLAEKAGLTDAVIINSCAVTAEAERQVRQKVRAVIRANPNKKVIVAGCSAQLNPGVFEEMPEVYKVLGNTDKLVFENFISSRRVIVSTPQNKEHSKTSTLTNIEGKSKAFIQVQQGCNNLCAFCIVPLLRGKSHSFDKWQIINQVREFLNAGYRELILTGVDISAYGVDFSPREKLSDLVSDIFSEFKKEDFRLRLSSLDPAYDYSELLTILKKEPRLAPHFHFSVQSGDNEILRSMKRRHKREDVIFWANEIKKINPLAAIGADIITGFPGEDEEHFKNSLDLISEAQITHAHIFPYSPRPQTLAAEMPNQVAKELSKTRAKILIEKAATAKAKLGQNMLGKTCVVLVEKNGNSGYAENYMFTKFDHKYKEGELVKVKITNATNEGLEGTCFQNSGK